MKKVVVFCLCLAPLGAMASPAEKPAVALYKSYLATIRNSIGSRFWRNLYYQRKNGRTADMLQNGNLSCAYFVSSILLHFGLFQEFQTEVEATVAAMKTGGWQTIEKPVPGSVIVWSRMYFKKSKNWHMHIGFFLGPGRAVSNSSRMGYPAIHNLRYQGRKIVEILWHPRLAEGGTNGK